MIHLLGRSPRQISARSLIFLSVVFFSMIMFIVPAQAQQKNAAIFPQGSDTTYVQSMVTTSTVQVNNLANPEVSLPIVASVSEVLGIIFGLVLIIRSVFLGDLTISVLKWKVGKSAQFIVGCGLIVIGIAIAGAINWLAGSTNGRGNLSITRSEANRIACK